MVACAWLLFQLVFIWFLLSMLFTFVVLFFNIISMTTLHLHLSKTLSFPLISLLDSITFLHHFFLSWCHYLGVAIVSICCCDNIHFSCYIHVELVHKSSPRRRRFLDSISWYSVITIQYKEDDKLYNETANNDRSFQRYMCCCMLIIIYNK